jgi:glutamate racemase
VSQFSNLPIGVFDSGIGGLTVVRQLRRVMPREDFVYLGDTARVPYGTKSPGTIVRFACEDTQFLVNEGVKAVVVACNTASAWAIPTLERSFNVPVFGVILPGAKAALEKSRTGRIGIIGTTSTIRSQAYVKAILARDDSVKIVARSCPLLVPLIEEGWVRHKVTRTVLKEYLAPLLKHRIDALVLGCTHYPLLKPLLMEVAGRKVRLVDSAEACADHVLERLQTMKLLASRRRRAGVFLPFVTDEVERFNELSERFLGFPAGRAVQVSLPSWDTRRHNEYVSDYLVH